MTPMSRLFALTLALLLLALPVLAGPALEQVDPALRAKLSGSLQWQLEAKARLAAGELDGAALESWLIRWDPDTRSGLDDQLVFVHLDRYPSATQVESMEATGAELILADWVPPLANHPTGFFLARVPRGRVADLAGLPFVRRLGNGEDVLAPHNDEAREYTGLESVRLEHGLENTRGEGVRVAILDSGVDVDHPDIPDPVIGVDYSEWPDSNLTVNNTVSGHGTHVAGTVLGRGVLAPLWQGMAPEAELVFLKIGNDEEALETAAGVAHSFIAAADYYDCDVANMSYGYFNEFLDGSAENEQAVDYAVSQGMIVFVSAGNSANDDKHLSLTVGPNSSSGFYAIDVASWAAGQLLLVNAIAYDGPDTELRTPFTMTLYNEMLQPIEATQTEQVQSPRGTESRYIFGDDPLPGNTTRYVEILNNSDHEQVFHLYLGVQTLGPYSIGYDFPSADPGYTVGSPAIADGAIAVAAYNSKLGWTNYEGGSPGASGSLGDIAYFSSIGPRIDGVQKPNLAAPGRYLASTRDGDAPAYQPGGSYDNLILPNDPGNPDGTPGDYIMLQGTSMASPAAAGATAAVLAQYGAGGGDVEFDPLEVRTVLEENAVSDAFTGAVPNPVWGWGKIDVMPLVGHILGAVEDGSAAERLLPARFSLSPVMPNPFNPSTSFRIDLPATGALQVSVYDLLGRRVRVMHDGVTPAGQHRLVFDATGLSSGQYLLRAETEDEQQVRRMLFLK